MGLKPLRLFRSTGYSSILAPGETRMAPHPAWAVLAVSIWTGFACNVPLWRELIDNAGRGLAMALALGLLVAAGTTVVLSLFGWRRTIKPVASLLVLAAAAFASGTWVQSLPLDSHLLDSGASALFQKQESLFSWHAATLLAALSLPPLWWLWTTSFRRLSGPKQFNVNLAGALAGGSLLALTSFLMMRGLP